MERRYSQREKEALGLVWASNPCARIEKWVLRLQGFNFTVVYRPGKTNIADALSRLNSVEPCDSGEEYDFVRTIVENSVPVALSPREIEEASYNEGTVSSEELREVWELDTVYIPLVRSYQGQIMYLW